MYIFVSGLVIYPPGPASSNNKTSDENKSDKTRPNNDKTATVPPPKPPSSTPPKSPVNNFRQKSNILAQQAAEKVNKSSKNQASKMDYPVPKAREAKVNLARSSISTKDSSVSKDSGIDTTNNSSATVRNVLNYLNALEEILTKLTFDVQIIIILVLKLFHIVCRHSGV